jgi:ABC-type multidrug transport system fused ATPase/permease subunit
MKTENKDSKTDQKKRITFKDIKEFIYNILYFLRLGRKIYGKLFYKNLAYSFVDRTISFSTSLFYGFFVDGLIKGKSPEYLYTVTIVFLLVQLFYDSYFKYFGVKMRIEEEFLSEKYLKLELEKYSEVPINNRLDDDFNNTVKRTDTQNVITFYKNLEDLILSIYTVLIASFAITFIDYRIILITILGIFFGFLFRVQSEKKLSDKRNMLNAYNNWKWSIYGDFKSHKIGNIDDNLVISDNSKFLIKKLDDYFVKYREFRYDMYHNLEKNKRIAGYIFAFVTAISYFFIYNSGILKLVDVGILIIVIASYQRLFSSVDRILSLSSDFTKNYLDMIYLKKFFEYKAQPKDYQDLKIEKNIEIEFKNVWFKYASSNKYALKNINFKISSGDILAIIGNNGAGKSTLMKLIFKIFEPTKGTILLNGTNILNIKDEDFLKLFHILPQEFEIEDMLTVEELIYLGNTQKKLDVKKIIWSAKNSTAHSFVKDLKMGYKQKIFTQDWIDWMNKNLKEEMVDLSAGQIRKIQIARLFYSEKPIIFMDEATSNVDTESTAKIFDNLKHLKNNQILGFITHNLLNINLANKILILKEGEIIEFDQKDNLLKRKDSELNKQIKLLKLKD